MFAGGRCTISESLCLGEPAERVSSLAAVTAKQGRRGELLFVTERQEFRQNGRTCLVEEQDIVYRSGDSSAPHPGTTRPRWTAPPCRWRRDRGSCVCDPTRPCSSASAP
jgi:3-methylfumaryl-CoA hydratase